MAKRDLAGAPERRDIKRALKWEVRAGSDGELVLEGYASVFDAPYDIWGGPSKGGFTEIVDRSAFDKTLASKPDLHLLINHEGMPLARTKSGTLQLSVDDHGLKVRAVLDRRDPDVQRLEPKMSRGDMDEMSFAFRVMRDEWRNEDTERVLREVSLDKGDVSIVNFGASPTTSAELIGAVRTLAAAEPELLAELRSNLDEVSAARATLSRIARDASEATPSTLSITEARALVESADVI